MPLAELMGTSQLEGCPAWESEGAQEWVFLVHRVAEL